MSLLVSVPTTHEMFKERHLKKMPGSFRWQQGPFQIYPLMSDYMKLPTPLLLNNYNCIFFIDRGSLALQIDSNRIVAAGPSIIFISSGTIMALEEIKKTLKGYFILMEDEVMATYFNNETALNLFTIQPIIKLKKDDLAWIDMVCDLLTREISKPFMNNPISHGFLQALLFKILELSGSHKSLNRTQEIAIQFRKLAHKHFTTEKSTQFYARALSVSENYLNRCVKSVFGKGAKEIILEILVLNARLLMWDTARPISEICYELNLADPSYFSRIFKNVTGKSPSEYRRSILHDLS